MSRSRQAPGVLVDAEGRDVIRILVRYKQKSAGWVNDKIARSLTVAELTAQIREHAAIVINPEDGDAVMSTVRCVQEFAGWVYMHISDGTLVCESGWER